MAFGNRIKILLRLLSREQLEELDSARDSVNVLYIAVQTLTGEQPRRDPPEGLGTQGPLTPGERYVHVSNLTELQRDAFMVSKRIWSLSTDFPH